MGQLHNLRSAFGPRVVRESGFTSCVEPGRKVLEILGKQVSVAIKSDLNRRVTEVSLNGFRGGALCDQQSGARVSQVANPQSLGDSRYLFRRRPNTFVEV